MTRDDAFQAIADHQKALDAALDKARSQFSIRICYVTAHSDLVDLTRKIVKELEV